MLGKVSLGTKVARVGHFSPGQDATGDKINCYTGNLFKYKMDSSILIVSICKGYSIRMKMVNEEVLLI